MRVSDTSDWLLSRVSVMWNSWDLGATEQAMRRQSSVRGSLAKARLCYLSGMDLRGMGDHGRVSWARGARSRWDGTATTGS